MKRITAALLSLLLLTGCTGNGQNSRTSQPPAMAPVDIDVSDVVLPDEGIICIMHYQNWAEGYQEHGSFICTDGKVFTFDFSTLSGHSESDDIYAGDLMSKLELIRQNAEPVTVLETERIKAIYSEGTKIDAKAAFKTENVACDAGSHTVTFCDPERGTQVCLAQYGDYEGKLRNEHSDKILELVENTLPQNAGYYPDTMLATLGAVPSGHGTGKPTDCEGSYFLLNSEQLRYLAEESGCPLDSINDEHDSSMCWFVEIKNHKKGEEAPLPKGMIVDGNRVGIVHDGEENMTSDCCTWTVFACSMLHSLTSPDIAGLSGNKWTIPDNHNVNADPLYFCGSSDFISEDLCSKVYQKFSLDYYNGTILRTQEEYDEFISGCDETGFLGERSVGDLIASAGTPDFSKGVLCIMIPFTMPTQQVVWGNTLISDRVIKLGDASCRSMYVDYDDRRYYLSFAFIPDEYIPDAEQLYVC